jgi:N-acetylglucosaminyl-diphospho-decaprenol L-rhamnosyltransferase
MGPAIDVVIVNYRTGPLVVACLESLAAERATGLNLRAIVVDNASGDGSSDTIAAALQARGWDWAVLVRSPVNGGFGAGNNIGIEIALRQPEQSELVWLLNPDTMVMPGAATNLAKFMRETPSASIAGTSLLEGDSTPWPYAFRFPSILGELERGLRIGVVSRLLARNATLRRMGERSERADWVSGASMAIRTAALRDGLRFDESFFLYYEETDLCRQAANLGLETWYVPSSVVLHIAGQSTGVTGNESALRQVPAYWFESRKLYFRKNHGPIYAALADAVWVASHLVFRAMQALRGRRSADPPRLLRDFLRHCDFIPARP